MAPSTTNGQSFYDVLQVSPAATPEQIKVAYRRAARKVHPDVSDDPQAPTRFATLHRAYDTLRDPALRQRYDAQLRAGQVGEHQPFTAASRTGAWRRGTDLKTRVTVPFSAAAAGTNVRVTVKYPAPCTGCSGTGMGEGGPRSACPACYGLGMSSSTGETCSHCAGVGSVSFVTCSACKGAKQVVSTAVTSAVIPAGTTDGATIRVAGKGTPGTGDGPPGDLLLRVSVQPHRAFVTSGEHPHDVGLVVPVTYPELVLGATLTLPTPDGGTTTLTLPAGSPAETIHVIDGAGLKHPGGRGALRVVTRLEPLTDLTGAQRSALEQLQVAVGGEQLRAHLFSA